MKRGYLCSRREGGGGECEDETGRSFFVTAAVTVNKVIHFSPLDAKTNPAPVESKERGKAQDSTQGPVLFAFAALEDTVRKTASIRKSY